MHRTELVAALEEHLWAQLTLVKVAGAGRWAAADPRPKSALVCHFPAGFECDGDGGQGSGAGIGAGHGTAGLNLASLRLPGLPLLPEEGDPLREFHKTTSGGISNRSKGITGQSRHRINPEVGFRRKAEMRSPAAAISPVLEFQQAVVGSRTDQSSSVSASGRSSLRP